METLTPIPLGFALPADPLTCLSGRARMPSPALGNMLYPEVDRLSAAVKLFPEPWKGAMDEEEGNTVVLNKTNDRT